MIGKSWTVFLSIIGIIFLYFLSSLSQPILINIDDVQNYEGKKIKIEGIVTEHHFTNYGNQMITLKQNNKTLTVFVEEKTDVEYGDKILVIGQVQKYKNTWQIVANKNNAITILQKWQNISSPLWQLAENPTKYNGLNINITGYIERLYNTYFYITDSEEKHSLIVFYDPSDVNISLKPGQKVRLFGKFIYDEDTFRYKLEVGDKIFVIKED